MKIIITSGGTSERIDEVRKITNSATGRLGALIAEELSQMPGAELIYVCGENAALPSVPARIVRVGPVRELRDTLERLLTQEEIGAVVHAMAVSDYTAAGVTTLDAMAAAAADALFSENRPPLPCRGEAEAVIRAALAESRQAGGGKLSSYLDGLLLFLEKTPKVISMIKELRPQTVLVGFKLLSGAEEDELLRVGHELLSRCRCDFVLANDARRITADGHAGLLIRPDGSYTRLHTKREIARAIAAAVRNAAGNAAERAP